MHATEHRSFEKPDEVREFPNGRAEIVKAGGGEIGRLVLQPGWRWSNDVKPIANTESCEAPHFQYHVSGQLADPHGRRSRVHRWPRRRHVPAERSRRLGDRERARRRRRLVRRQQLRQVTDPGRKWRPVEVVEGFGAAWADHDLDAALALVTDDCVFDATGPAPDGMRHVGRAAIRRAWEAIFSDATSRFEPEETFAADDRVVQLWRYSWDGGHVRGVDVFRVRDGKVAEKLSYVKG